jgi:SAM-dependent methyltransferase
MNPMGKARQSQENLNSAVAPPDQAGADRTGPALTAAQRSNLWPLTAWGYPLWRSRSLSLLARQSFSLEREAALFRALCRPQPGQDWLDAGTSTGFYAGVLARAGCRVLAADLSAPMLAVARRREARSDTEGSGIDWLLTNLEASGLPDASFDGVTVGATLNETRDPARFLAELARLLRPGGQLWLMYLGRTGGPLQQMLSRPAHGGLGFPDPAWVARQLPGFARVDGLRAGAVVFERYLKLDSSGEAVCNKA